MSHTRTPWTLETVKTSIGICHKIGPFPWKNGKQNHACVYVDWPGNGDIENELLANARLIAAAPRFFDALEQIARLAKTADRTRVDVATMLGEIADAAIAKAKP